MPSLPADQAAARLGSNTPLLTLRLDAGRLTLAVGSGQTPSHAILEESQAQPAAALVRPSASVVRAFNLDVFKPYNFGGISYDPLGSIAESLARLPAGGPEDCDAGSTGSDCGPDGLMAFWTAMEADLYRFAKDPGFTAALDRAETEEPVEYRRFARLNNLYRDLVKLLLPYGIAPRRWSAWLRGQEYRPILPVGLAARLETLLAGRAGRPEAAMEGLTTLLLSHGARLA